MRNRTVFPRGGCGYADLVIAYADAGAGGLAAMAGLLGFGVETRPRQILDPDGGTDFVITRDGGVVEPEPKAFRVEDQLPVPFWYLQGCEFLVPLERVAERDEKEVAKVRPKGSPPIPRLGAWNEVMSRLRVYGTQRASGRRSDMDKVVRRIALGQVLERLPRLQSRRWGRGIQIILDRSQRLIPFQADLDWAALRLANLFPRQDVVYVLMLEDRGRPFIVEPGNRYKKYIPPDPGSLVVALGDVGSLAPDDGSTVARWERWGFDLRQRGCRILALSPVPVWRMQPRRLPSWTILPWERGRREEPVLSEQERLARTERLLALLAPAVRIEPGLMREIRLLLGNEADAGTEADCWIHPDMVGRSRVGGTLDYNAMERLWPRFEQEKVALQRQVVACLRRWHDREGLGQEVWDEEVLRLPPSLVEKDQPAARRRFKKLPPKVLGADNGEAWFRRVHRRAGPTALYQHDDPQLKAVLDEMYAESFRGDPDHPPPPGFDLRHLYVDPDKAPVAIPLCQQGDRLVMGTAGIGSPLGIIHSRQDRLHLDPLPVDNSPEFWKGGVAPTWQAAEPMIPAIGPQAERRPTPGSAGQAGLINLRGDRQTTDYLIPKGSAFLLKSDCEILTFGQMVKPRWADAMGRDGYGLWTQIAIPGLKPVTQRLRWIPPGRFLMGSPEGEYGRYSREGPQHEVTFKQGFWLFDTACTQDLWQAVMGDNPSQFQSPDKPVERVNFEDVQKFLEKINQGHPGLELTLPSEAQWEYACRAGTTTPFSFGEVITPKQVNYDGNYPYRDGPKGEYREQTVAVASLPANPWGLYEMHGNVWELCADGWHDSYAGAPVDGSVWQGPTGVRVCRGGSWNARARGVRAAYRFGLRLAVRLDYLGFRCARVQS